MSYSQPWTGPLLSPMKRSRVASFSQAASQAFRGSQVSQRNYAWGKRSKMMSRYRKSTRGARAQLNDPTIRVLNPRRERVLRIQRTCNPTLTYSWSNTGVPVSAAFRFDPSGTFGNTSNSGTGLAIQDWSAFTALYDQYKVNKIIVNLRWANSSGVEPNWNLYVRFNYDTAVGSTYQPTPGTMCQLGRVVEKTFNASSSCLTYSFFPRVNLLADNEATLATDSRQSVPMDWTDINYPVELLGLQVSNNVPVSAANLLTMEITYDISFRGIC